MEKERDLQERLRWVQQTYPMEPLRPKMEPLQPKATPTPTPRTPKTVGTGKGAGVGVGVSGQQKRHAAQHRIHAEKVWTFLSGVQVRYYPQYRTAVGNPKVEENWHYYSDGNNGKLFFKVRYQAEDFFRARGVTWE
jgi:hypothetical protein